MNESFFGLRTSTSTGNSIDSATSVNDKSKSKSKSSVTDKSVPWSGYSIGDVVDCTVSAM